MDIFVLNIPTPEQLVATQFMNSYRPLNLCKNYVPYSLGLFTTYLTNAKDADDKLVAWKDKTDLYVYLEKHTVKDTLKPLLIRLQRRAVRG